MSISGSEPALIRKAVSGDRDAFASLIRVHRAEAYRIALGYLGNEEDARDIVQEASLKALSHIQRFDVERPFFPWFYRILRNLCFNFTAKRKRHGECPLVGESEGGVDPADTGRDAFQALESRERAALLWSALDGLSPEHKEIILLRHFRDRSYEEIAEILDIPRGTVMSRLYYARAALRRALDRSLGEEDQAVAGNPEAMADE
jgi:RNA polymerase sigma-70 factor (ECF subfamily)